MLERRTDLALEARESFPKDDVEISGVSLDKETVIIDDKRNIRLDISTVKIMNEAGAKKMNKPQGSYITIESGDISELSDECMEKVSAEIGSRIEQLAGVLHEKKIMVAGLGNRYVTADSLGPIVVDNLNITRHFAKEYGVEFLGKIGMGEVCAISPGVMAQTGMEAAEILESVADAVKPDVLIVIDALAARSVKRVTSTIQITDTGINPGSGVGNHRVGINEDSIGVKVISIGVPTVVEAEVIVSDRIEEFMKKQNFNDNEIQQFIMNMGQTEINNMYVTPKNIDETVRDMGELVAMSINGCMQYAI